MKIDTNKRIISLVLALALCLQLLPATLVTATEVDEPTETIAAEAMLETVPETTAETVPETTVETVPETTAETVPETTVETVPETTEETVPETTVETMPETTEETVPELTEELVEAEPDPWEIIAACGGPKTPYVFGPDITYELPKALNDADGAEAFAAREYTYIVNSLDLLKELLNTYHRSTEEIVWPENTLISMPLDAGEQLILLSVTDPQVYQKTAFKAGTITGAIPLTGSVTLADGSSLTFQGLGSETFPFQGSFANSSFTVKHTLFNELDYSSASFSGDSLTIDWDEPDNSKGAIVATKITGAADKQLKVNINSEKKCTFRDAAFGEISGGLNLTISFSNGSAFENTSSNTNAGLVANTVTGGALSLTVSSFPSRITIGETKNNAGLLVGYLKDASLTLDDTITPPSAIIQAPEGGAGGIVGRIDNSTVSNITLNDSIDLTSVVILGKYTGGVAGYAKNVDFTFEDSKTFTLPGSLGVKANNIVGTGDVSSKYTGGIFGWYEYGNESAYSTFDGSGFSFPASPIALHVNVASGEAGALFGHLVLGAGRSFTVAGTSQFNISSNIVVADTAVNSAGGLVGALEGASKADELIVGANVTVSVADVTKDKIKYLGGLAGTVKLAAVSVKGVTVTVPQPSATTYFGGLVASLGADCVLKTTETVMVSTTADGASNASSIAKGGGLVGEANSGSVVQLSGTTDLSNVAYTAGGSVGQLVAKQDSALIFATGSGSNVGWTYQRSTATARVDDIGNYGQVIRLGDNLSENLIYFGAGNQVCFSKGDTETYGTIGSADDFALHAIAFTTNDKFGLYDSSISIQKASVTLTHDIDLTGTGIQGLTRDNGSDQWDGSKITGGVTFNGGSNTLTINTGEIYGQRGEAAASGEGSGQCYRHGYYGLMGKVNSAIVQNLTINTTMNIGADVNTYAGAVFGYVSGGHSEGGKVNTLDTVTLSANSEINLDGTPPANTNSHVGGLIGYVEGDETGVTVTGSSMLGDIAYTGTSDSVMLGGILGKDNYATSIDLQFDSVTVGGTISSATTGNAHVGGLVADICAKDTTSRGNNGAEMTLKKVVVSSAITTAAKTTSGGLLGYYWDNVDVTFDGTGEDTAVTTYSDGKRASLSANGAAVGGLCFAATGRWNMQGKAVDMGSASISNGSGALGLLVCHGERQGSKPGAYTDGENAKALYLVMDTNWETAYKNGSVQITSTATVFDEIVAYTAGDKDITLNDAGIISLHTTGDKVNMIGGVRNTYVNRTGYGIKNQTNPNSRYYYNLDIMGTSNSDVNTPEELLLWSVGKYGAANISRYLSIPDNNNITGNLNMDGYSYYPVNVANTDVTVRAATITFYNKEIEDKETTDTANKSTRANDATNRTQHFAMHSGLFYNYYTDNNADSGAVLTVQNVTLLGTVGMVGSGSGALVCGSIYGYNGGRAVTLSLTDIKLDEKSGEETKYLSVEDFNKDYAPLLIHQVSKFATLNITGVTANAATAGATSLMGKVGDADDEKTQGINVSFSQMKLPDTAGRFTKATMLHSFYYGKQISSVTYNFTEEDANSQTVTYGKEIGGTEEYTAGSNPKQVNFYKSDTKVPNPKDNSSYDFSGYLPYVATPYQQGSGYHEIQVNHHLTDVAQGCGTYGDPYRISSADELMAVATALFNGSGSKGWVLNISGPDADNPENTAFCSSNSHFTYRYNGNQWVEVNSSTEPLSNDTVMNYLRNAYYQVTADIEVTNFPGLGTRSNPFRGVVVGGGYTITLKETLPKGFIVCSYGSVVKNLKLNITGSTTVSFMEIQDNYGYTSESYYGGVIGCILGGDNIIDDVDVTYSNATPITLKGTDSDGKKKDHLIPVGGYVGVISGGGVIFRGENGKTNEACEKVTDPNYFYANPYVGRVIQGFAVQEGDGTELDNSEKNYQICWLDSTKTSMISVANNTITLSDAQALLVFSSVTNSGGAGGGNVLPYFTNAKTCWTDSTFSATSVGGKVRNADYSKVGNATAETPDYLTSLKDDFAAFGSGNASYLDTHYADGSLFNVCGNTAYTIKLESGTYYMDTYGNGYRSISPRYLANAVCGSATDSTVESNYQYLNPLISGFDGQDATIKTNIVSKEYVDDDHHAIAVGGIFNTLRFTTGATMQNVTIGGTAEEQGTISHEYYEWTNGSCADATHKNWGRNTQGFTNLTYTQGRGLISIGGFAGNTAQEADNNTVTFESINTKQLNIKGPFDAGGILGHSGLRVTSPDDNSQNYNICSLVGTADSAIVPSFQNCTYKDLRIDGGWMVGGYLGFATSEQDSPAQGKGAVDGEIKITFTDLQNSVLGADSHIICQRAKTDDGIDKVIAPDTLRKCLPAVGGLIGCSSFKITVDNTIRTVIRNVEVRSTRSAGGVVAWPFNDVKINNLSLEGSSKSFTQIGDLPLWEGQPTSTDREPGTICEFAGGLVGYFEANSKILTVTNCTVSNLRILASLRNSYPCYAGGIVGNIYSAGNHQIVNCNVTNLALANVKYTNSSKVFYRGGLIGRLQNGNLYGVNLLVDSIHYSCSDTDSYGGNLLGTADSGKTVYLAGVSIQNTKNLPTILQTDIGGTKPAKCYVAYADYTGAAQKAETGTEPPASSNADKTGSVVANSDAPHVTTSPRGVEIPIASADAEGNQKKMYLYGDGANPDIVNTISDQSSNTDNSRFYYSAASGCSFDSKYSSDFYAEMGLTAETANGIPNFPVLQVPVADQDTVTAQIVDYLNLVSNNGYSTALDTNVGASEHVSAVTDLYRWNESGYFEKITDDKEKAFRKSGQKFETSYTNYDSGKNQFELLTVTFTEASNQYKIQVPIVVRRMLEVDFTATLKDSPSFKPSDYEVYREDGFKSNIIVGYGVSVSAMLTYTYNRAIGEPQSFGWQTHLDSGGFMGAPEQTIQFYNPNSKLKSLPEGTQLILLDCADNNKAYCYSVETQSEFDGTKVKLSYFQDSQGNFYSSHWLSEIMGVTAEQNDSGKWVRLDNETNATARIKTDTDYQYFRAKAEGDTDTAKLYNLTAAKDNSGKELQPTEQFYLVIYIPDSSVEGIPETNETEGKNLNGYISAALPGLDGNIACNINAVRVKQGGSVVTDPRSSSESTYNFLSGYVQSLSDQSEDKNQKLDTEPEAYILLDGTEDDGNYLLHMDLVDEITVVKGQKDTADTDLYFKADVSLPRYAKGETDAVSLVTANGFPTGCYGTAEFYVYLQNNEDKTYYTWSESGWVQAEIRQKALSYEWTAEGGNMELHLGTSNTKDAAVSLAGIRQLAKNGNEKFYVETKMDIHMSVPAAEQVIAGAITKGNAYTKLSYTTYLASTPDGFPSTNYVESKQGEVRYYQSRSGNSTITHSANDPTQLGINCSDLASANGVIYTTGVYDLTTVSNAENLIMDASGVEYTLTLWQRQEGGEYKLVENDLDKYVRSVYMNNQQVAASDSQWQWTDTKTPEFGTTDPENSKRFLLPIRVQVNTDVETNDVTFANYQLRLTATLYKEGKVLDQPVNKEIQNEGKTEYIRYDYVTYTITRLLTSGYWGQQN